MSSEISLSSYPPNFQLAATYLQSEQYDKASETAQKITSPFLRRYMEAEIHFSRRKFSKAVKIYKMDIYKGSVFFLFGLCKTFLAWKKYKLFQNAVKEINQLKPGILEVKILEVQSLNEQKKYDQSIKILEDFLKKIQTEELIELYFKTLYLKKDYHGLHKQACAFSGDRKKKALYFLIRACYENRSYSHACRYALFLLVEANQSDQEFIARLCKTVWESGLKHSFASVIHNLKKFLMKFPKNQVALELWKFVPFYHAKYKFAFGDQEEAASLLSTIPNPSKGVQKMLQMIQKSRLPLQDMNGKLEPVPRTFQKSDLNGCF